MSKKAARLLPGMVMLLSTSIAQAVPVADANGPYVADEGSVITLDGSGSYAPVGSIVSWEWDLDNDGDYDDASGEAVSYLLADGPLFSTVGLRVTDDAGATDTDISQVQIANVAPTVDQISDFYTLSGTPIDVVASFFDPAGSLDNLFSYEFDWGDGSSPTSGSVAYGSSALGSHTFTGNIGDVFTTRVTITDKDGGSGGRLFNTYIVRSVPEPTTLALMGLGLAGIGFQRRRSQKTA